MSTRPIEHRNPDDVAADRPGYDECLADATHNLLHFLSHPEDRCPWYTATEELDLLADDMYELLMDPRHA